MRRLRGARRRASHRDRRRQSRSPRSRDRAARSRARRGRGRRVDLRLRPDADDAARRRDRGAARPILPGVTREPHGVRLRRLPRLRGAARRRQIALVCRDGPVFEAGQVAWADVRERRRHARGARRHRAAQSGADGVGHLRLRRRVRAVLRPGADRRDRREEHHAGAAPGKPAAAHRRDAGGDAERDRPRERGRRRLHRREAAGARRRRRRRRERVRDRDRPLRRGLQAAQRRATRGRARDQRFVPAREERRDRVRPARRGAGATGARDAAGDLRAAAREAVAQRHRHPRDGARLRGRGSRRPVARQHAAGARRRHRDATARARATCWADSRVPRSGRSRCAWCGRRRRPCASRSAGSAGS